MEYASKAVENGSTSLGLKCKDGIILGVEKIIQSNLLVPSKNKKIQTIDRHIGAVYSGLIPDGRALVARGRDEARSYKSLYKSPILIPGFIDRIGLFVQNYTCYNSVRPFGINAIFGGVDEDGPHLYMIEPSGVYWGYNGAAAGKGRQIAKSELEKLDLSELSAKDAVKEALRILYLAHESNKDKEFEIELSWICLESDWKHEFVPEELLEDAVKYAEEDSDEESDEAMDE